MKAAMKGQMTEQLATQIGVIAPGLFLAILTLALVGVVLVWRWIEAAHPTLWHWAQSLWRWAQDLAFVGWLRRRFPRTYAWLGHRLEPGGYLGLHLTIGLALSVLALSAFSGIADQIREREQLDAFDAALSAALVTHTPPLLRQFFAAITLLGSVTTLTILGVAVAIALLRLRRWTLTAGWIVALGGGGLLNFQLKSFFQRPRPQLADPLLLTSWSFPSGHAMSSLIAYGLLAYLLLLWLPRRWDRAVVVATTALVLLIGLSRVYLGVHYLSDVIAGYAAGTLWLACCISGLEVVRRLREARCARVRG